MTRANLLKIYFLKNKMQFILFSALSLRLQGPLSKNGIGRLEVFHKGQWGTICDNYWSMNDAKVACRQLGYKNAVKALKGHQIPDGSGQIWLSNVGCTGREKGLGSCNHRGWGVHSCQHNRDAGVECSEGTVKDNFHSIRNLLATYRGKPKFHF